VFLEKLLHSDKKGSSVQRQLAEGRTYDCKKVTTPPLKKYITSTERRLFKKGNKKDRGAGKKGWANKGRAAFVEGRAVPPG